MTIETMAKREPETTPASAVVDQKVVAELVARAGAEGVSLTGGSLWCLKSKRYARGSAAPTPRPVSWTGCWP